MGDQPGTRRVGPEVGEPIGCGRDRGHRSRHRRRAHVEGSPEHPAGLSLDPVQGRGLGGREQLQTTGRRDDGGEPVTDTPAAEVPPRLPLAAPALAPHHDAAVRGAYEDLDPARGVDGHHRYADSPGALGIDVRIAHRHPIRQRASRLVLQGVHHVHRHPSVGARLFAAAQEVHEGVGALGHRQVRQPVRGEGVRSGPPVAARRGLRPAQQAALARGVRGEPAVGAAHQPCAGGRADRGLPGVRGVRAPAALPRCAARAAPPLMTCAHPFAPRGSAMDPNPQFFT